MNHHIPQHKQTGSALIVALSMLLVLTILGVASMQSSSLQEKMAGNSRDSQVAFQAAEAALRAGELYVFNMVGLDDFNATGTNGYFTARTGAKEAWQDNNNWANAVPVTYASSYSAEVARDPFDRCTVALGVGRQGASRYAGTLALCGLSSPGPRLGTRRGELCQ